MKFVKNVVILVVVTCSSVVIAAEEEKKSPWKSSAELGYVNSSGNTNTEATKAAFDISHEVEKWVHKLHADALSIKTETTDSQGVTKDERSAAKWYASFQTDYKLDEFNYLYGLLTYEDDRFNGFDYQSKIGGGYGHWFVKSDIHKLKAEVGPGVRLFKVEQIPPPDGPLDASRQTDSLLRLSGNYVWEISKTSKFTQDITTDIGEEQKEWKSITELQADISTILAMKISHVVIYLDKVAPGIQHYDRVTGVTLVYNF